MGEFGVHDVVEIGDHGRESAADFEETLDLLREVEFQQVYSFTYSPRPGTRAWNSADDVPKEEKSERLQQLIALQNSIQLRQNRGLAGATFEVLVDGRSRLDASVKRGKTTCNRIVHIPGSDTPRGNTVTVRITRAHINSLTGEPVAAPDHLDSERNEGYKGESVLLSHRQQERF